ncbi:MAG: phosphoserine phosphatase [Vibrio sp.]
MDALKNLSIKKHPSLIQRFPEIQHAHYLKRKQANWIVFSECLHADFFRDLDFLTGQHNAIVDVWRVGHYEVALMAGELTKARQSIVQELGLEYAVIQDVPDLSKPGLMVMDMDSTAIQIECIDEIAKLAGVGDEVSAVTERAMQGELDFEQSLRQRVGQLAGADESILEAVRSSLPLMPELQALVHTLQLFGWKIAIASGGFTYFSDYLQQLLSLDHAQANVLDIQHGRLTGEVLGDVVSAQTKADILHQLADHYEIETHNTVAVGDGANDLVMMNAAGLGIAYHAKPKVQQRAQTAVQYVGLGGVLCILSAGLVKQGKLSWKTLP